MAAILILFLRCPVLAIETIIRIAYSYVSSFYRQLSGIGTHGSFQLVDQFIPGPHILAGKDTESDYEEVCNNIV